MSKSKYMEAPRKDSTMTVVITVEALTSYLFSITNNEKQFPKAYRYTLSKKIRNKCLDLNMEVYKGCILRAYTVKEYKKVRRHQNRAYDIIIDLKALINIAANIVRLKNPEYIVKLYTDVVESFNHWVKNTKRSERKAVWRESLTDEDKRKFKDKMLSAMASKMDHDTDGFIILKKIG